MGSSENKELLHNEQTHQAEGDTISFATGDDPTRERAVAYGATAYGYDPSSVWKVDQTLNPGVIMRKALESGKVKVDDGSGNLVEATVDGIDFNIVDAGSKLRFSERLNLEQSRAVMLEGKDVETFTPSFKEAADKVIAQYKESQNLAPSPTNGIDADGHEVMTEDWPSPNDSTGSTPDAWPGQTTRNFIPLGNGPMNQQLYLHDQWDMIAKAFEAYHHNPYAHRAIEIIVNFVLGRGFNISFSETTIQDQWNVDSERLKLSEKSYVWLRDLERAGELFLRPVFDAFGVLKEIQNIEASTILEVITDPLDINDVHGYYQQYLTPIQIYGSSSDRTVRFVVNTFAADEIIHIKVNNTGSEKRGRSTLFPAFEYLQMIRDYHVATANKAIANACLIFDWSISGAPSDVQSFAQSLPPINFTKPIASIYHSENAKLNAVAGPPAKSARIDLDLETLINAIAVATGVSKEYLGADATGGRSGALVATQPVTKQFEQRQKVVAYDIFTPLINKWLENKLESGAISRTKNATMHDKLKKAIQAIRVLDVGKAISHLYSAVRGSVEEVPIDKSFDISFPEIVKGDLAQMIENYAFMQSMGWWSQARAANMATQEFGSVKGYNYYDEQQAIKEIGIKPIAQKMAQSLMCDQDNPPMGAGGVMPELHTPPKSSNKNQTSMNVKNNPAGAGASHLRKAVEGLFRRNERV